MSTVMKSVRAAVWALALASGLAAGTVGAATCTWTGAAGDGKWSTAGNWSDSVKPTTAQDTVVISSVGLPTGADGVPEMNMDITARFQTAKLQIPNGSGSFRLKGLRLNIGGYVGGSLSAYDLSSSTASFSCLAADAKIEIANDIYITGQRAIYLGERTDVTFSGDFTDNNGTIAYFYKQGADSSKFTLSGTIKYTGYTNQAISYSNVVFHVRGGTNVLSGGALGPSGSTFRISSGASKITTRFSGGTATGSVQFREMANTPNLNLHFDGDCTFDGDWKITPQLGSVNFYSTNAVTFNGKFTTDQYVASCNLYGTDAAYRFASAVEFHNLNAFRPYLDGGGVTFDGPVSGINSYITDTTELRTAYFRINNTFSTPPYFYIRYFNVIFGADNVFTTPAKLTWGYAANNSRGVYDLNGYDQTITGFSTGATDTGNGRLIKSDAPATLTVKAVANQISGQPTRLQGAITLVYAPEAAYTFTLTNFIATATGDLVVSNGTFCLAGEKSSCASFASISVCSGATFKVDATATGILGTTLPRLDVDSDAKVIMSGNASIGLLRVDGEYLPGGRYQANDGTDPTATKLPWLTGGAVLTLDGGSYWKASVKSGDWDAAANWNGDVPTADTSALLINDGSDYNVRVTVPAAVSNLTVRNGGEFVTTIAVSNTFDIANGSTVQIGEGGCLSVGDGGALAYCSYVHNGNNFVLPTGGTLELTGSGTATISTKSNLCIPIRQSGGDIVAGGSSKLTLEGAMMVYLGSGTTILKDSAVLETVTGKDTSGKSLNSCRLYTQSTVAGVTNHIIVRDQACIRPKNNISGNLDQVVFGYPNSLADKLVRIDYESQATSYFGHQIELGGTWGYAEMNVSAGLVKLWGYGLGVGGFYYNDRSATKADVVGVLNVTGGAVDVNATDFDDKQDRVRGLILGEGWYDKKTDTSDNLFTGYVNLSGGVISNRYGAVILGAGAAKGVWTQTGGRFENTSEQTKGPMILGWLGGEGAFILSNGTVNVASANIATYVGGAETNLTPWVLEKQAPSSADAAKGLLSLQGGTFTTAGDVIVGQDGDGTVEVGASGVLNARNLELKVAAATDKMPAHSSAMTFVSEASSCGRIALTGALKSVAEATLSFDLTAWDRVTQLTFLTCRGLEGTAVSWNNVTVTGVDKSDFTNAGGGKYYFRQDANGIVIGKSIGFTLIFR